MDYDSLVEATIQFGDTVVIVTDAGGIIECNREVVVINVPQEPGDLWQFQCPDGSVLALNPYHSSFIRIEKAPRN